MVRRISSVVAVVLALFVVGSLAQAQEKKADATGTWKWTTPARGQGQPRENVLKLKQDGEKLTGTISGRQETAIEDGKVVDGKVSFKVIRKGRNGGPDMTISYEAKLDGDTLKGTITMERNGKPQSNDWEAKREAEKAAQ